MGALISRFIILSLTIVTEIIEQSVLLWAPQEKNLKTLSHMNMFSCINKHIYLLSITVQNVLYLSFHRKSDFKAGFKSHKMK